MKSSLEKEYMFVVPYSCDGTTDNSGWLYIGKETSIEVGTEGMKYYKTSNVFNSNRYLNLSFIENLEDRYSQLEEIINEDTKYNFLESNVVNLGVYFPNEFN